jgi:hypothetical protein
LSRKRHYENAKIRKKKEKTEKSSKKVIFIPKSPYIYKKKQTYDRLSNEKKQEENDGRTRPKPLISISISIRNPHPYAKARQGAL